MSDGSHRPDSAGPVHPVSAPQRRLNGVDFWRGFVLCEIFINHVPGNIFEKLTSKNFGFSDSSEAFVFISGLSLAFAYGRRLASHDDLPILFGLARRVVKLYAVHIALSLAGLGIFAAGAAFAQNPDLMQVHGRDLFVDDPGAALVGLLSLGHQLGYFNILPLYVLLVAMAPVLFALARVSRALMLAVSLGLYLLTRAADLNVPSWPMRGEWFFDPFAWQFLMAIGLVVGLRLRDGPLPRSRIAVVVSAAVVAIGIVCVTDGFSLQPGLYDRVRAWADLDKTSLGVGRLVHFLGVAYLVYVFGVAATMRRAPWFRPLCLLGRHGLWMFAILSLLAALGQVLTETFGHTVLLDSMLIGGGLAVLLGCAAVLQARSNDQVIGLAAAPRRT